MRKFILIALSLLFLLGCAAKKLTREEQVAWYKAVDESRTRVYDVDQETLINTAEQALLSFEDDYVAQHSPEGFVAHRRWMMYLIIAAAWGEDYWYVNTKKTEDNKTWIQVKTHPGGGASAYAYSTGGGGAAATTVPQQGALESSFVLNPGLYKLFFNRIDFILGLTKDLLFCEDIEQNDMGLMYNNKEALCEMGNDRVPPSANQPMEVIDYYNKLLLYYKASNQQNTIGASKPVKKWGEKDQPIKSWE